jgi:hypothetical protein
MAAAQHKLSRRSLLAVACAAPAIAAEGRWIPDQVRDDEGGQVRDDGRGEGRERWAKALARYRRAEAGLEAVAQSGDDEVYDRALGCHGAALARLLRTPAPDLAAVAGKLDLIVRHSAFELPCGDASFAALQQDLHSLARLS